MHEIEARNRRITPQRMVGVTMVAAMALLLAACQPVTLGNPGTQVGNDLVAANCPAHQATPTAPCGPQPMLWAAINGPYDNYENGDPYSTHCAGPGGNSGPSCTQGNSTYRSTGYTYAIDVNAADVGTALDLQGYDVGTYPRTVGVGGVGAASRDIDDLTTTSGSQTVTSATANFTSADLGKPIFTTALCAAATNCPPTTIQSVTNSTTVWLLASARSTGVAPATIGYDCNTNAAPFNSAAYSGMSGGNCQTGDDSDAFGQNFDVQVYDSDGSANPSYATPLAGCHFSHSAADLTAARTTYKNQWVELCTFTPTVAGTYALRVRNSGIAGMADAGQGTNSYALKVLGGSKSKLHAVGDQSVFMTPRGPSATKYLADVASEHAGKKLDIDVYDPGDGGGSSPITVQVKAPPGGGPSGTPAGTGVAVPAAGVATSCQYNATPSLAMGGGTLSDAANCTVTTHTSGNNMYNGHWLRIEVTLDPAYTCSTDCWWTLEWNWGTTMLPTDRITYTVKVV